MRASEPDGIPNSVGRSARCSFCNKEAGEVGELIEGTAWPGRVPAYICEDCVELCAALVEQRKTPGGAEEEPDEGGINAATQKMLEEKIAEVLSVLTGLQSQVITLRYGLSNGFAYTLAEVAERLGISSERVREIEVEATEILRSTTRQI